MNVLDQIMDVSEASQLWNLKPGYIKNLCAEGKINARKVGRDWIIDKNQQSPAQPDHPNNWRARVDKK